MVSTNHTRLHYRKAGYIILVISMGWELDKSYVKSCNIKLILVINDTVRPQRLMIRTSLKKEQELNSKEDKRGYKFDSIR